MIPKTIVLFLPVLFVMFFLSCSSLTKKNENPAQKINYSGSPLTDTWRFNGITVKYHRSGKGDPIIFLHNGGTDHRIWDFQIDYFSKTHTVIAPDLPGYGESSTPKTALNLPFYTKLLETFIEDQQFTSVTLMGNCMGSAIALNYAQKHPEKVKSMVLFNILTKDTLRDGAYKGFFSISGIPGGKGCLNFSAPFIWLPGFFIKHQMKNLYGSKGVSGEPDSDYLTHLSSLFKRKDQLPSLTNLLVNMDSYRHLDSPKNVEALPPSCVFWGEKNKVLPKNAGVELWGRYNFKEEHVIEHAGHLLMREEHKKINDIINSFFSEIKI